jgi:hypothetical protein
VPKIPNFHLRNYETNPQGISEVLGQQMFLFLEINKELGGIFGLVVEVKM